MNRRTTVALHAPLALALLIVFGAVGWLAGSEAGPPSVIRIGFAAIGIGGVQAVARDASGVFSGGGDPRRGGAAIVVVSNMDQPVPVVKSPCVSYRSTSPEGPELFRSGAK